MKENRLSDAEMLIMQCFWENGAMKTDPLSGMVAVRGWKPTTLLTFLSRLVKKGMLAVEKQGKSNLYRPLLTQTEYRRTETTVFLNDVYGGNARNFLVAMADSRSLTPKDIAELKIWLAQQEVDSHD